MILLKHSWPGNIRELQNTLTRAALWSQESIIDKQDIIDAMIPLEDNKQTIPDVLGRELHGDFDLEEVMGEVARHYLSRALKEFSGNKSKAAKALNFKSYQRLDVWLKKYYTT